MFKSETQRWLEQQPKHTQMWLQKQTIWSDKDRGPLFGSLLRAYDEPFNGNKKCYSDPDQYSYEDIGVASSGVHDLTQTTKDEWGAYYFTISELEVWEVAFE